MLLLEECGGSKSESSGEIALGGEDERGLMSSCSLATKVVDDKGVANAGLRGESALGEYADCGLSPRGMTDCRLVGDGTKEDWGLSPGRTLLLNEGVGGVNGGSSGGGVEANDTND